MTDTALIGVDPDIYETLAAEARIKEESHMADSSNWCQYPDGLRQECYCRIETFKVRHHRVTYGHPFLSPKDAAYYVSRQSGYRILHESQVLWQIKRFYEDYQFKTIPMSRGYLIPAMVDLELMPRAYNGFNTAYYCWRDVVAWLKNQEAKPRQKCAKCHRRGEICTEREVVRTYKGKWQKPSAREIIDNAHIGWCDRCARADFAGTLRYWHQLKKEMEVRLWHKKVEKSLEKPRQQLKKVRKWLRSPAV